MTIETGPSTGDFEMAVVLVLQELEIVVSPAAQWLTYIAKFFTWYGVYDITLCCL